MKAFIFSFLVAITFCSYGQTRPNEWYPPRNKPCPPFEITGVKYYSSKTISNKKLKGKWYVMDFWNSHCGACVASFPRMDSMQKKFKGKVDFFFIGVACTEPPKGEDKVLDSIYESRKKLHNLSTPFASALDLGKQWNLCAGPDIVVVDPQGVVRAHTYRVTSPQIDSLIHGQSPYFPKFSDEIEY